MHVSTHDLTDKLGSGFKGLLESREGHYCLSFVSWPASSNRKIVTLQDKLASLQPCSVHSADCSSPDLIHGPGHTYT